MRSNPPHGVVLAFSGGGSQYVGMGKAYYDRYDIVKSVFEEANDILGYNLGQLCFEGPLERLSEMNYSQVAIYTLSVAYSRFYCAEFGLEPSMALGHSLGEYGALTCSGAISFTDALQLVQLRGELLQEIGIMQDGCMMAVNKLSTDIVEAILYKKKSIKSCISVYNSPYQHVISGPRNELIDLEIALEKVGGESTILNIRTASHCPMMLDIIDRFHERITTVNFQDFQFPVVSNVTGKPYDTIQSIPKLLTQHLYEPVLWDRSIRYLVEENNKILVEIGPQSLLMNLTKYITSELSPFAIDNKEDVQEMYLKLQVRKPNYKLFLQSCLSIPVATQNHNFDSDYHDIVVSKYHHLKRIKTLIDQDIVPSTKQLRNLLNELKEILRNKHLAENEIERLIHNLVRDCALERLMNGKVDEFQDEPIGIQTLDS